EARHVIVRMAAQRIGNPAFVLLGKIVALPDIVQRKQFDHEMVHAPAAGPDHGEGMVPTVEVEEIELERLEPVVGDLEAQQIAIEWKEDVDVPGVKHRMAHSQRSRLEAGDRPAGEERFRSYLGSAEHF